MQEWLEELRMALSAALGGKPRPAPLNATQLHMFCVYLVTMLRCGMGLVPALSCLGNGGELRMRFCANSLLKEVEGGMRLSQAMFRQPESFPPSFVRVVETAEQTGRLTDCMELMSATLERQNATTKRLSSALVYPCFLVGSSVVMVFVMLYYVFPMIIKVTKDAGVEPPFLTRALIAATSGQTLLIGLVSTVLLSLVTYRLWLHPRWGRGLRWFCERFTPPGKFYVQVQVMRSMRQLAMMIDSGVDIMRALKYATLVGEGSTLVASALEDVTRRVRTGETLAAALAENDLVFGKTLPAMVSVSDYAGDAQFMLNRYCDMLEENLNNRVDSMTAIIEPLLLAAMGFVIGTILIAAFLPIYNLVRL